MLPHTTKRRITTNLKTKNNKNCQKIKLYGSTTTKKVKKKHSFRLIGGAEIGNWDGEDAGQGGSWQTGWVMHQLADGAVPYSCADKPGRTTGEQHRLRKPGFQCLEK